jgi:hypothetical protein
VKVVHVLSLDQRQLCDNYLAQQVKLSLIKTQNVHNLHISLMDIKTVTSSAMEDGNESMMPEEDESAGEPEHELAPTAIVVEAQGAKASIALEHPDRSR